MGLSAIFYFSEVGRSFAPYAHAAEVFQVVFVYAALGARRDPYRALSRPASPSLTEPPEWFPRSRVTRRDEMENATLPHATNQVILPRTYPWLDSRRAAHVAARAAPESVLPLGREDLIFKRSAR